MPGPGAYATGSGPTGPEFAFRGRQQTVMSADGPGPGQYDQTVPQQVIEGAPNWSFAKDNKGLKLKAKDTPGPGNYDPRQEKEGPQWRFGTGNKISHGGTDDPGPGAYELPSAADKTAFSLTSRHPPPNKEERPGPGAYSPSRGQDGPQYSLSQAARKGPQKPTNTPGPGQYDLQSQAAPTAKFGSETRAVFNPKEGAPGPGAYTLPSDSGPQYTMQGRGHASAVPEAPGPGHYNQQVASTVGDPSISYNFGSEIRSKASIVGGKRIKEGVGPGMYHKDLPPCPPYWSFGHQMRGKGLQTGPPGPGQYDVPTTIAVVANYAMPRK